MNPNDCQKNSCSHFLGGDSLLNRIEIIKKDNVNINEKIKNGIICIHVDRALQDVLEYTGVDNVDYYTKRAVDSIEEDFKLKEKAHKEKNSSFVSLRLHMSPIVRMFSEETKEIDISLKISEMMKYCPLKQLIEKGMIVDDKIILPPNSFVNVKTIEKINLPSKISAFLQTRTDISIKGLSVTSTYKINPGFRNTLNLQLKNNTDRPIVIPFFYPVAELYFTEIPEPLLFDSAEFDQRIGSGIVNDTVSEKIDKPSWKVKLANWLRIYKKNIAGYSSFLATGFMFTSVFRLSEEFFETKKILTIDVGNDNQQASYFVIVFVILGLYHLTKSDTIESLLKRLIEKLDSGSS